jgi:hypothetical protein
VVGLSSFEELVLGEGALVGHGNSGDEASVAGVLQLNRLLHLPCVIIRKTANRVDKDNPFL